jgi:hypothetical protein
MPVLHWINAAGSEISATTGATTTLVANTWTPIVVENATAPALATTVIVEVRKNGATGGNWAIGNTYDIADMLIEQSATANTFFCGDTPADGSYTYSWVSTANQSGSLAVAIVIAAPPVPMFNSDFQFRFGDSGVTLNTDVASVPFVDINKVSGLDSGEFRITERQREGMDGGYVDARFLQARTIVIEGMIYGNEDYLEALRVNFAASELIQPLYYRANSNERMLFCKSLGLKYDWTTARRTGGTPFQLQFKAEDPTIYGTAIITGSTPLSVPPTTGMDFPIEFPLTFGGAAFSYGGLTIINYGTKPTSAIFTLTGGVTDPEIVDDNTGRRLSFTGVFSASDMITVDTRNRTVLLNGTYRRTILKSTSRWFSIQKGANVVRFLGSASAGTPTLSFLIRPAYN